MSKRDESATKDKLPHQSPQRKAEAGRAAPDAKWELNSDTASKIADSLRQRKIAAHEERLAELDDVHRYATALGRMGELLKYIEPRMAFLRDELRSLKSTQQSPDARRGGKD